MIQSIMACDDHGGIARGGVMPWPKNKRDLQHFKNNTSGAVVVMGRSTWEAKDMPTPLPGRTNIVITRDPDYVAEGATIISSDIKERLTKLDESNIVIVIGGAQLFTQLIDLIDVFHLTRIAGEYDCDTFLPLDLIAQKFKRVRSDKVDDQTTFETYIARKHDFHSSSEV